MYKRSNNSKNNGYSLFELAITLVVLGILSSSYLYYRFVQHPYNTKSIEDEKIRIIEDAILSFFSQNGRLPCPADPTLMANSNSFGIEALDISVTPAACSASVERTNISGEMLYKGMLPTRTLGIADEYAFDVYQNRFAFIVQQSFINNDTTNTSCALGASASDDNSNPIYRCVRGQASGSVNSATLDIEIRSGYNILPILNNDAVYVILSYGENGYGAYPRYSSTRLQMPSNQDEIINSNNNNQIIQSSPGSSFDDVVVYKTRNDLVSNCNLYFNNACTNRFGIEIK